MADVSVIAHDPLLRDAAKILALAVAVALANLIYLIPSLLPHATEIDINDKVFYGLYWKSGMAPRPNFIVTTISQYAGARGSTASKVITIFATCLSITGVLGSLRWIQLLEPSKPWSSVLLAAGFAGFLCVPMFELDSEKEVYLRDKVRLIADLLELEVLLPKAKQQALNIWSPGGTDNLVAEFLLGKLGKKISDAVFTAEQVEGFPYTKVLEDLKNGVKSSSKAAIKRKTKPKPLQSLSQAVSHTNSYNTTAHFTYPNFWGLLHGTGAFGFCLGVPIAMCVKKPILRQKVFLAIALMSTVWFAFLTSVLPLFPGMRMSWVPGCSLLSSTWMNSSEYKDPDWPSIYSVIEGKPWGKKGVELAELLRMFEEAYDRQSKTRKTVIDKQKAQELIDHRLKSLKGPKKYLLRWMDKDPYGYRSTMTTIHFASELLPMLVPCMMAVTEWWTFTPKPKSLF